MTAAATSSLVARPGLLSRYRFCFIVEEDGVSFLTDREPYGYRDLPDNRRHKVRGGERLWTLAGRYFALPGTIARPTDLWWVIADFQPEPIFDPTVKLEVGRVIHIPSHRTLLEEIFASSRKELHR